MKKLPRFIWHIKGSQPGPTAVVLGGVHGNELPGIEVLRALLGQFDLLDKPAGHYRSNQVSGDLFLGFGNPEAIIRNTRGASSQIDLNRAFRQDLLTGGKARLMDVRRARELAPLLRQAQTLIDLHSVLYPSPALAYFDRITPAHLALARLIPVEHVLTDANQLFPNREENGTTDAFVDLAGGVGICYEVAAKADLSNTVKATAAVNRILSHLGTLTPDTQSAFTPLVQKFFAFHQLLTAEENGFSYDPGMEVGFAPVVAGQRIGHYPSGKPLYSDSNGAMVFQLETEMIRAGHHMYAIIQEIHVNF